MPVPFLSFLCVPFLCPASFLCLSPFRYARKLRRGFLSADWLGRRFSQLGICRDFRGLQLSKNWRCRHPKTDYGEQNSKRMAHAIDSGNKERSSCSPETKETKRSVNFIASTHSQESMPAALFPLLAALT